MGGKEKNLQNKSKVRNSKSRNSVSYCICLYQCYFMQIDSLDLKLELQNVILVLFNNVVAGFRVFFVSFPFLFSRC